MYINRGNKGFTLVEVLIVVAVIAIIAAIALPSYQRSVQKGNRSDGIAILNEIMQAEERYAATNGTYTTNLTLLGFVANQPSKDGLYRVTAAACGTGIAVCVQLTANAQGGQVNDANGNGGNLTLDSRGVRAGY